MARFNAFAETRRGRDISIAALAVMLTIISVQVWYYWPGPKPATLLEARAEAAWRGGLLLIRLLYRVDKVRDDCTYASDRFLERDDEGILRRLMIQGASVGRVEPGDTSWQEQTFTVPGELILPGRAYTLNIRGVYRCPRENWPADRITLPLDIPPRPERSEREPMPFLSGRRWQPG